MREEVWEYINLWCKQKECSGKFSDGLICEKKAIREALDFFEELGQQGIIGKNPQRILLLVIALKIPLYKSRCIIKALRPQFSDGLICEKKAIREALDFFEELDYVGAVIRIQGQIEACCA